MSSIDDKLNEVLNIADEVLEKKEQKNPLEIVNEPPTPVAPKSVDVDTDFDTGRNELYKMLEKGNTAIDGILNLAKEGEHPRAYEVAGNLIKQVADTVDKLQDLQGKLKTLKDVPNKTSTNIKQALFVGSSAELHKMLKNKNKNVTPEEDKTFKDGFNPEEHKYD